MKAPKLERLFDEAAVAARIEALAERLHREYDGATLTLLCIAEGSLRFAEALAAGLARRGAPPEQVIVRAHRTDGTALGPVALERFDPEAFAGKDVLVVDDICDEGETLSAVLELAAEGEPRSLRVAVLVDKRERRKVEVPLDYVGFEVERGWVVGFGMDLDGELRELDWIGRVVDERF